MPTKKIAALIEQEVQPPTESAENSSALAKPPHQGIATTQNTLQLASQGLFDESKAVWKEFVAFDKEHQLAQRVGAQLWRLTQVIGKPVLVLSLKGIQAAVVTITHPENRAALAERFSRFRSAQEAAASLENLED
jgi:hypothetical protein